MNQCNFLVERGLDLGQTGRNRDFQTKNFKVLKNALSCHSTYHQRRSAFGGIFLSGFCTGKCVSRFPSMPLLPTRRLPDAGRDRNRMVNARVHDWGHSRYVH